MFALSPFTRRKKVIYSYGYSIMHLQLLPAQYGQKCPVHEARSPLQRAGLGLVAGFLVWSKVEAGSATVLVGHR